MRKKLAHSLLLMAVIAALMVGGNMVQEGRDEMWVNTSPGISVASNQIGVTGNNENTVRQVADIISNEVLIKTNDCPHAHRNF